MTDSNLMKMAESSSRQIENSMGKGEVAFYLYCRYIKIKGLKVLKVALMVRP